MNSEVKPREKKKKKTNPSTLLPDELVVRCLARISSSYYPKLSLVCKKFRSLIVSNELIMARLQFETDESFFHVCLQLFNTHRPTWFSLWIKPNKILTNAIVERTDILLVPSLSSYFPRVPDLVVMVGSDSYRFSQSNNAPSPVMCVCTMEDKFWRRAPNMTVARENHFPSALNGKIYVMGGCEANESAIWAEVFDTKTQTWEPLPDPGSEIRFAKLKAIDVIEGKFYLTSNEKEKDYVYDPKQGKWYVIKKRFLMCVIGNICYSCDEYSCEWYDRNSNEWREVRGFSVFNSSRGHVIEIASYRGKLLILWDKFANPSRNSQEKHIWCALVAFERRNGDDEVWGNVEWSSNVLTVPSSYVFLRSQVTVL